jgi:hypothetical protein
MRPGEVTSMRTIDIHTSGRTWLYRPRNHKMEHTGRTRTIRLGPKAQNVLREWLRLDVEAFVFQPAVAEAERKAEMRRNRKSKIPPSDSTPVSDRFATLTSALIGGPTTC